MARPRKKRTEAELQAQLESAAKQREDAEQRAKDARKAEAAAQKELDDLRAAERQKRMNNLLDKLAPLGYPMNTDDDVTKIVARIEEADDTEVQLLKNIRDLIEICATIPLRSEEDFRKFGMILSYTRSIPARTSTSVAEIMSDTYNSNLPKWLKACKNTAG